MKLSKATLLFGLMLLGISACSNSLIIEDVNYAQYVESVLIPNEHGIVTDYRNSISFSVNPLSEEEFGVEQPVQISEIRLIRNQNGYYFITANQFKNVYVFEPKRGELKLKETIEITEQGLDTPVFNWREPFVEVLTNNKNEKHYLTEKGIINENEEEEGES